MPFIYLLGEGSWAETWRKDRKRQPTNGQKSCSPLNGQKIMKITVLPIKWFALMKSDVFIDVIKKIYKKEKGWRRQNAEFIKRIICEGIFYIALGAVTLKDIEWNSSGELIFDDKMFLKVFRVEESRSWNISS
jgi:hypothetical protein